MKGKRKKYHTSNLASAVFMILALLWLTISAPFVVACQQELAKQDKAVNTGILVNGNDEEAANPFSNTTEEKAPTTGGNSLSEEYLHDHHIADHFFFTSSQYHKLENAGTYNAFHGELLVPPPNAA